jgi:hypothetical protein
VDIRCRGHLFGNGPYEADEFPGNRDHDLVRVFPVGEQLARALAQPHLCLPADILDDFGLCFEPQLSMPTDFRGVTVGPGALDQSATGMGIPGFGKSSLAASRPTGGFRRRQDHIVHELAGVVEACQVAEFCHCGDGHGALHAGSGLQRLNDRVQTPGEHVLVEVLFQTLQPFRVFGDRAEIFLTDEVLSRGGADDFAESPEGAGLQVARLVERISCRSKKAFRRNFAALRSRMASARAWPRSWMASSSPLGT